MLTTHTHTYERMTETYLYYKLTNEPKGSDELIIAYAEYLFYFHSSLMHMQRVCHIGVYMYEHVWFLHKKNVNFLTFFFIYEKEIHYLYLLLILTLILHAYFFPLPTET